MALWWNGRHIELKIRGPNGRVSSSLTLVTKSECSAVWSACLIWIQEVVGSNPTTPTTNKVLVRGLIKVWILYARCSWTSSKAIMKWKLTWIYCRYFYASICQWLDEQTLNLWILVRIQVGALQTKSCLEVKGINLVCVISEDADILNR